MNSPNTSPAALQSKRLELLIVGRVMLTLGVASLSVGAAIGASLLEDVSAPVRTAIGLVVSFLMVGAGQLLSQRSENGDSWVAKLAYWASTNLMSAGYVLAYFFVYSLYYVPGLHVLGTPYACWVLGPMLAGIATWHGSHNRAMRFVTPLYTLLVTGHVLYHALTSAAIVDLGFASFKAATIACVAGALWCAFLSRVYERLLSRYTWPGKSVDEACDYLFNRVAHELYFVLAALNAMALPLVLGNFDQAPLWWSVIAPCLLAISWKTGNWYKHGVVGFIWGAAAVTLLSTAYNHGVTLPVLVSVPLSGCAIGLAYRFRESKMVQALKLTGYCVYLYAGVVVALLAPYLQYHNVWDAMPYWMIASVLLAGLGLSLRDRIVHDAGWVTGLAALFLFAWQWQTWTWSLVGPVIAGAYALSVAYGVIARKGGWKQAAFLEPLPFDWKEAVSAQRASNLETLWSWVGVVVLLAGSFLLINRTEATIWWSVEALLLVALSSLTDSERYRSQSYVAFALAAVKLAFWDLCGGTLGLQAEPMFTLFRAVEFAAFGACCVAASALHFRDEGKLAARLAAGSTSTPDAAPVQTPDSQSASSNEDADNR